MKTSNKTNIITGAVLLSLSAAFTISLILQLLNFGVGGPGHDNIFFLLGNILYTVYGFSSLWIPAFLLITGLSCFATKWTAKRTVRLLTAIVPFFTSVLTENICRSILKLESSSFPMTKIIISLVIGAMLMVIEFLFAGIIADRVNDSYYRITKLPRPVNPEYTESKPSEVEIPSESEENSKNTDDEEKVITSEENSSKEESPFDAALSTLKLAKQEKSESVETQENSETTEEIKSEEPVEEVKAEEAASVQESVVEDDEPVTPATILTQEEYAALIQQEPLADDIMPSEETEEVEELEWNNLPPKPETLPPEYQENYSQIDENDKSLEFPPKDDEFVEVENFDQEDSDETIEASLEIENDEPVVEYSDEEDFDVDFSAEYYQDFPSESPDSVTEDEIQEDFDRQFIKEANDLESELLNDIDSKTQNFENFNEESDFSDFSDFEEENPESIEFENSTAASETEGYDDDEDDVSEDEYESVLFESSKPQDTPVVKYVDSVVENPSYPYGIRIHNESEPKKQASPAKAEAPKPIYPSTITLTEQEEAQRQKELQNQNLSAAVQSQSMAQTQAQYSYTSPEQIEAEKTETENQPQIEPEFYDIDPGETAEAAKRHIQAKLQSERIIRQRQQQMQEQARKANSTPRSFSSFAADVFSDMENDIRGNNAQENEDLQNQNNETEPTVNFIKQQKNNSDENYQNPVLETPLQGPSTDANDLTSDDLTAFFNAQEEENAPRTQEIQGNPPKTNNRAAAKRPYVIPSDLLTAYKDDQYWLIDEATKQASINLTQTLAEFNIEAQIIGIKKGPVVTMFELLPAPGVKLSKIAALQDNIALSLAASSVRIVAPIPGKQAVGIEVPNKNRSIVGFREIIEMPLSEWDKMAVPVVLGKDILGKPQLIDLVKTPHMLIAGATGSGKSVCVNSLILSILFKRSYKDVKLILVDPKVVELKLYNNIPHLLTPVITEPKKAFQALQYCLCEMERRYALLDGIGVRDISSYNQRIKERNICTEKLPYIVVIIDEFADLMATTGRELESVVARLTAMSRAVGIHLVLATQRPSVNVITGLIKANIPSRIAFMVASRTDSNIIIDSVGAEKLLGRGDMLYTSAVDPFPVRIQGTFVSDQEVENVVECVKEYGEPEYIDDEIFIEEDDDVGENVDLFGNSIDEDPLYDQALEIVVQAGKASASYIQRRLKIGYNRAARLVEEMEERGIVGPANGSKPREVIHIP